MKKRNGFISMTLVYSFLILFLFIMLAILKTYSRNNKILTAFSEKINNDLKVSNEQKGKLYYRILIDNLSYPDNVQSSNVSSSSGINFSMPSSDTNGKGLYYTIDPTKTVNGSKVYYFRGNIQNNYVIYAGYCFRIVRTTEGNNIRMQYAGVPTNGVCPTGTITAPITNVKYNQTRNDNTFIGYKVSIEQACTSNLTCNTSTFSSNYGNAHKNLIDSNAKSVLDEWIKNNIYSKGNNITKFLADTSYCSDRKITTSSEGYTGSGTQLGYGNNITYYNPYLRLEKNTPSYNCQNENDKFSQTIAMGNGELLYPAALITMDELIYAGAAKTTSSTYFLANGNQYLTMTPSSYKYNSSASSNEAYVYSQDANGKINEIGVTTSSKIFPVITLKGESLIKSGTGLRTSPYVIGD